jgi:Fe-S-cluster-containing dehydrogenase component
MEMTRRELLTQCSKLLVLTATAAKALDHTGKPASPDDTYHMAEHWWGMIIDIDKCIGCGNCVRACSKENQVPPGYFRTWVERYQVTEDPEHPLVESPNGAINGFPPATREDVKSFYVPKLCNHCVDSPCVQVCPVGPLLSAPTA